MATPPNPTSPALPSNLRFHATNLGHAPKVYVTYNGKTYEVEVFRNDPDRSVNVTHERDWTDAAKDVIQYLESLEGTDNAAGGAKFAFNQFKTADVVLQGPVATSTSPAPSASVSAATVTSVKWDTVVTDSPQNEVDIAQIPVAAQTKITSTLTKLGQDLTTFKPYVQTVSPIPQTAAQQGSPTTPPNTPPVPPTTPLPTLTFTRTPRPALDEQAALTAFLNSQATNPSDGPIHPTQQNLSATTILSSQLTSHGINHTPEQLHKGAAARIAEHPEEFNNPEDIKEMFDILKERYNEAVRSNHLDQLKTQLSEGAATASKVDPQTYDQKLHVCLANKSNISELDLDEKKLIVKAYANLISKTTVSDTQAYPKVFFKAVHAFFNTTPPTGVLGLFGKGKEKSKDLNLVIVEKTTQGSYKLWQRLPARGIIRPDKTVFVLHNPTATGGKYSAFLRTNMVGARDVLAPSEPEPAATGGSLPSYYNTDKLALDVGGRGNCGAYALADAVLQKEQTYYRSETEWKSALETKKVDIRNEAMEHLFNNADTFANSDELFEDVLDSIKTSKSDIASRQSANAAHMNRLIQKDRTSLTPVEKKWLVELYAVYAREEGNDLDKPFYLAYAMKTGQKIAIIQNDKILMTAPSHESQINFDDYLFVEYNGSNHFVSINRARAGSPDAALSSTGQGRISLSQMILNYNKEHSHLSTRREFLESLSRPADVPTRLKALKDNDPYGYLVVKNIAGQLADEVAAGTGDVATFITALNSASDVEIRMNGRTDLKARFKFFKVLAEVQIAKRTTAISPEHDEKLRAQLNKLKEKDPVGFFALREIVLGNKRNGPEIMPEFPITDFVSITSALCKIKLGARRETNILKMALTGAQELQTKLNRDPKLSARAAFFGALLQMPTSDSSKDTDKERRLQETTDALMNVDSSAYVAFKQYANTNSIKNLNDLTRNRNAVILYVLQQRSQPIMESRGNVVENIIQGVESHIEQALNNLESLDPVSLLTLKTILRTKSSNNKKLGKKIAKISQQDRVKLVQTFLNQIDSPSNVVRKKLLNALDEFHSTSGNREALSRITFLVDGELKDHDLVAYLAIQEHLNSQNKEMNLLNVSNLRAMDVINLIAQKPHLQARADFLIQLRMAKSNPKTHSMRLAQSISNMNEWDPAGWLALTALTKKADPNLIWQTLTQNNLETAENIAEQFNLQLNTPTVQIGSQLIQAIQFGQENDIKGLLTSLNEHDRNSVSALMRAYKKTTIDELAKELFKIQTEKQRMNRYQKIVQFAENLMLNEVPHKITEACFDKTEIESDTPISEGFGERTIKARSFMIGFRDNFKQTESQLTIKGVDYNLASGELRNISTKPVVSCGSTATRELIVLDPEHSPELNRHYNLIKQQLESNNTWTEKEKIDYVMTYIQTKMIPLPKKDDREYDRKLKRIVDQSENVTLKHTSKDGETQIKVVPIDTFIENKMGVCRHHALVTAYILDKLAQDGILNGVAQHMRDNVGTPPDDMGGHVWATFTSRESSGSKWHIDTLWNVLLDFSDAEKADRLKRAYGDAAIDNEIRRTEHALDDSSSSSSSSS